MELKQILSQRTVDSGAFYNEIVFEWEDEIASELKIPIVGERACGRWVTGVRRRCRWIAEMLKPMAASLRFEMTPHRTRDGDYGNNKRSIIPCIIDFFLRSERELDQFYRDYQDNSLVLISSREAYEFLKKKHCPLNIRHWGLSLPNRRIGGLRSRCQNKRYDLAIMGRVNDRLGEWLEAYKLKYRDLRYLYQKREHGHFACFDNSGAFVGMSDSRDEYFEMMSKARISFYATPSMDGGRLDSNGFNQVTPRYLEMLACGCHVLSRYPHNADTEWYELTSLSPALNTYDEFEHSLNAARQAPIDVELYESYLQRHSTSARVSELERILQDV